MRSPHACAAALLLCFLSCAAFAQGAAPAKSTAEPAVLETPTGRLHGTLEPPQGAGPFPVALIIAGSGPVDRNGNTPVIPGANIQPYLISWFKYDAAAELAKLDVPVLLVSDPALPVVPKLLDELSAFAKGLKRGKS